MNKSFALIALIVSLIIGSLSAEAQKKSLFDGKSLTGWHVDVPDKDKDANIPESFIIRNGC